MYPAFVLLLAIAAALVSLRISGYKLLSVQTASMQPAIRPGDALIVAPVSFGQLRLGDIISYQSPRDPSLVITHRLVNISGPTGQLTTQGDGLKTPDPVFPSSLVAGRAIAIAPKLGLVLNAIHNPLGLAVAVYMPAVLIIAGETGRLAGAYARPFYSARL